jgi:hypothetical protein
MVSKTLLMASGAAFVATRVILHNWGATQRECRTALPGDELVADPAVVVTRAVSIEASAAEVWSWLVQIGQDRGGLYSYTRLENLFGLRIHNADQIRPEWQHLEVGDEVRLVPRGWCGMVDGYTLTVAQIVPQRTLVLRDATFNAVWSFHIRAVSPNLCRLVTRGRSPRRDRVRRLAGELLDPVTFVMTRRMLLGIKARAERDHANACRRSADSQHKIEV